MAHEPSLLLRDEILVSARGFSSEPPDERSATATARAPPMETQRTLAYDDERFTRFRERAVTEQKLRCLAYESTHGREYPFTEEKDVLVAVLTAISRTCDVALPEGMDGTADPRHAYDFVMNALIKFGESRQERGRMSVLQRKAKIPRPMKQNLQALATQIHEFLREEEYF